MSVENIADGESGMAAQSSRLGEAPAVNDSISIEIEDAALAKNGLRVPSNITTHD